MLDGLGSGEMNAIEHEERKDALRENGHWWVTKGHEGFKPEMSVNTRHIGREEGRRDNLHIWYLQHGCY